MSIDLDDAFGAYSREELEETLRAMDPKKDPKDYAAVKAALARALPEGVPGSCLDVAALSKGKWTCSSQILLNMASRRRTHKIRS